MRLMSSRAIPSRRRSSESSTSRATVRLPSLLTSQPGMSSEMISTSVASTLMGCPSTSKPMLPSRSSWAISAWERVFILAATPFINLPNFLPMTRKLHFTFLTRSPSPSTKLSSFTLTSLLMSAATASIWRRCSSSMAGTMI